MYLSIQFGGEIWLLCGLLSFFLTIITIIITLIHWFCYAKCSCLNCGIKVMFALCLALTIGGVIGYVVITDCEECCYDHTRGREPRLQASQCYVHPVYSFILVFSFCNDDVCIYKYIDWAIFAAIFQMIAVVCSCGLGYGFD